MPTDPADRRRPFRLVARTSLGFVAAGVPHVLRVWPGLLVVLAVYVVVSVPLVAAGVGYPQLIGIVAATLAAVAWYGSPLGRREASRRLGPRVSPPAS